MTNAVYGFTSMLIKLLAEERPDLVAVFFDSGAPTVRLEKDADYKAGRRETPQDFTSQLGLIEEVLEAMRIPVLRIADGNEADDAIGTLAVRAHEQGIDATIVTADRDFFQLVRPGITVMFNRKRHQRHRPLRRSRGDRAVRHHARRSTSTSWRSRAIRATTSPGCPGSATRPPPSS